MARRSDGHRSRTASSLSSSAGSGLVVDAPGLTTRLVLLGALSDRRRTQPVRSRRGRAPGVGICSEEASADTQAFTRAMEASLSASTRKSYARALAAFHEYVQTARLRLVDAADLMPAVAAFLGHRLRNGYAAAAGRTLYAALNLFYPNATTVLRPLARGLSGWERARPPVKRPPLTRPLVVAMAIRLVAWGYPAMAVSVLLSFHCYLRIGELLRVECWHLVPRRAARTGGTNARPFVHIPRAKTGVNQDVEITDADVWLLTAVASRVARATAGPGISPDRARLFPLSEQSFRRLFAACATSYGLPSTVVPHSLRHGGATHDYISATRTPEEVRVRGRWRREKSMQHYVGSMRSALALLSVPEAVVRTGHVLGRRLRHTFMAALEHASRTAEAVAFRRALQRRKALSGELQL